MNRSSVFTIVMSFLTLMIPGVVLASSPGRCSAFAAGSCPSSMPSGVTSFYFIDYAGGSDSNSGASETAPFQHIPCSANATGNAAAACTSAPGTGWIFKGGVTVDYHSWPANVPYGGTNAAPTYIGPDPGWFTGSNWSRPIFSGGGSKGYDASQKSMISDIAHHTDHLVVDNIEFTGIYWTSSCPNATNCAALTTSEYASGGGDYWEVKNVYIHGWNHSPIGADPGNNSAFIGVYGGQNSSIHDSVADGSDSSQDCCSPFATANLYNTYQAYADNYWFQGNVGPLTMIHDNVMVQNTSGYSGVHENCIHSFNATGSVLVYNNLLECEYATPPWVTQVMLFENDSVTHYIFNNVIASAGNGQGISVSGSAAGQPPSTYKVFNNTIESAVDNDVAGGPPQNACYTTGFAANSTYADNFCITNNNNSASSVLYNSTGTITYPSPAFSITCAGGPQTNKGMTQICAPVGSGNGNGNLNKTETYPFAPLDSSAAATIGTGQNNSSYCSSISAINSAAGTACLSDTTLGISYNSANHTVSSPGRTPILRPSSGGWQIGAYEFGQGAPTPPTGLAAIVQ
jgi:hypothetical protein